MSTRLDEIAEREAAATPGEWRRCGGATPKYMAIACDQQFIVFGMADCYADTEHGKAIRAPIYDKQMDNAMFIAHARQDIPWLISNARNAIAYCDRILAHNPNGAELMFLTEVKRILTGASDGRAEGG